MRHAPGAVILFALAGMLAAFATAEDQEKKHAEHDVPKDAVAKLIPTVGHTVNGIIVLTQEDEGVRVTGDVWNLTPGEHGFHIHEFGDLRAADGTSAGGHYNPEGHKHGGPDAKERHAGDLGNITAGRDGRARVDILAKDLQLHFVIGRSLVVHADRDDFESQPSGDAGARVALGVIGFAEVKQSQQPPNQNQAARQPSQSEDAQAEQPPAN